jgi:N-hydroxyarylamine O-acetyltransferase
MSGPILDLDGYLHRIGFDGPREATLATLIALHRSHVAAIPFENLDVLLRKPISLELDRLQAKLVRSGRGGYCFEHNTLFAAALRTLGFSVSTLEARVRPPGSTRTLPRTHMVLRVEVEDRTVLADVGFGGDGPLAPVDLNGSVAEQGLDAYRIVEEGPVLALQIRRDTHWQDLYAFGLEPALPADFEVANHYTSTHPASAFTQTLTVQRSVDGERRILRHRTLTVRSATGTTVREITDDELPTVLRDLFGLELDGAAGAAERPA